MKFNFSRLIPSALVLAMLVALMPVSAVFAAPGISISPGKTFNDRSTIVDVVATEIVFDSSSKIYLDGDELPGTVFVDAQTLRVTVPAGMTIGDHIVTVSAGGGIVPNVSAILKVTAPPLSTEPSPFVRPQVVVNSTKVSGDVQTGGNFNLRVSLNNSGTATAYNAQAVFTSADLVPTKTGGVVAVGLIDEGVSVGMVQSFYVPGSLFGKGVLTVDLSVTYYDYGGTAYTDKFTLSIPVSGGNGSGIAAATATPTGVKSSQLVISSYTADVDPLQPGEQFSLKLTVQNVGNAKAQRITMIVGGGSSGGGGGTPQPGGVSGGGGDFANFAPVGASNVQSLGDLAAGDSLQASQSLIVNVNTAPGAYPMRITFSYLNDKNEVISDEQVITLLVYSLPSVDVSFYRPPDPFFVGQLGMLPIQVVNLGKRLSVMGNIKVSASSGFIENGTSLVGALDAGGYFTLDSMFTAEQSGLQTLDVTIEYIDDFNQPRTITKTLEIEVMEGFIEPTPDPSMNGGEGGEFVVTEEETILHKIFRFIKGLFGLDSAWPVFQAPGGGGEAPFEETVPVKPGKGG